MAYATVADVEALFGGPVDESRATILLDIAASMIDAYAPSIVTMVPPPPAARVVNANMVVRNLTNPLGVKSEQLASFSTTYGSAAAGMVMSADDMAMLDAVPMSGNPAVYDIRTPRPEPESYWPAFFVIAETVPATTHLVMEPKEMAPPA